MSDVESTGSNDNHDAGAPPTDINPYEVLCLPTTATASEIKTAYRKLALAHHPDKVSPEARDAAHVKFQEIAFAYSILSDEKRRARYDRTGRTDEIAAGEEVFDWNDYFQELWQGVVDGTTIEQFKEEYQGSEEERGDLLESYKVNKGDMEKIFEEIMCSEVEADEARFREIIDAAIEAGEVEAYKKYRSSMSKKEAGARLKKARKEAKEAEELAAELGLDKDLKKTKRGNKADDEAALGALIRQRQQGRMESLIESMEAKYAPKPKKGKRKEELEGGSGKKRAKTK